MTAYVTTLAEFADGSLRAPIRDAITNAPRSLQTRIGPSELGTPCTRCLVEKLAGITHPPEHLPWLPAVGTAVHAWLDDTFTAADRAEGGGVWLTETQVTVGAVAGVPITGHADLFHVPSGSVVDWKVVGASTLADVAKEGRDKDVYRVQKALYAKGMAAAGHYVSRCAVAYLPRNHVFLDRALVVVDAWDDELAALADDALARAELWATALAAWGPAHVLAQVPEHTKSEFSCRDAIAHDNRPQAGQSDLLAS